MKASYDKLGGGVTSLLKSTWWAVLIYAVLLALTIYFRLPNKALHDWGEASPIASYILQTLIYLLTFLASIVMGTALWSWLNHKPFVRNLWRFTWASLASDFVAALLLGIALAGSNAVSQNLQIQMGVLAFLTIIALVLYLPFFYIVPGIMMKDKGEKLYPWRSYKMGLSHAGSIFMTGFLGALIIMILGFFITLPAFLLGGAQLFSQLGALGGDPLGVPGYFIPLFLTVLTAVCFLCIYLTAWLSVSFIYLYGAIEARELEKAQMTGGSRTTEEPIESNKEIGE